ncbi:YegP family protein [[Eubacterium] cellulosolvens]
MPAKFEVFKDASEQFRFRLVAPNGEIIAASEAYTTKAACMNGIESVKTNAPVAEIDDQTD